MFRSNRGHARLEAASHGPRRRSHDHLHADLTDRQISAGPVYQPALSSASQAGLVNNLNVGLSWGLFPLLFATADLAVGQIGVLFALYPAVWGAGSWSPAPCPTGSGAST